MSKEQKIVEKLLSFAFAMSENMIGLTKGNYDEKTFIKKTYEYLQKYTVDHNDQKIIKQSIERLEALDNANPIEALERLAMPDELHIKECEKLGIGLTEDFDTVKQALLELQAIKEAEPSEALECLERVYSRLPQWDLSRNVDQCNIIKQALLKAQTQELNNGGRLPNKEILYLKQSLEQCNDKPIFYVSRTYGNKYIVTQKFLDDLTKENARNEEILQKYYQEGITLDSVRALKKEMAELKGQVPEPKQYLKWEDLEFNHKPVFTEAKMGETIYKLVIGFDCTGKETIFLRTDNQQIVFHDKDKQFFNDLHLERVE